MEARPENLPIASLYECYWTLMPISFLHRLSIEAEGRWLDALRAALPDDKVIAGPAPGAEIAIVANPPPGALAALPDLAFVQSAWAGVDGLLADPTFPKAVPLARLVDPGLADQMAQAVVAHVLALHRQAPAYRAQQAAGLWRQLPQPSVAERPIGFLGYGELAKSSANLLETIGFPTRAWSRSHGDLDAVLACDVVVNLLPLTAQTRGFLSAELFARMKPGAALVNLARGAHLVEADLLAALDRGELSHAILDVFETEPLPPNHLFWRHPADHGHAARGRHHRSGQRQSPHRRQYRPFPGRPSP
jgi:glyoxylate/hydroxypyruvate reductase A